MNGLTEIVSILQEMGPDMQRLAGAKLTYTEEVQAVAEKAANLKYEIQRLMFESDAKELVQLESMASQIFTGLRNHLQDVNHG